MVKVVIKCKTYNQENYIKDTLEGIVCQETNFSFLVVVVDDASTDSTPDIIRDFEKRYPDKIKGIYLQVNHYSRGLSKSEYLTPFVDNCEYVAYCEGDDYWTDYLKLQKQVDFLDTHKEYGMCYAKCRYYNELNHEFDVKTFGGPCESFEEFMNSFNTVPTLTVLYRKELENDYLSFLESNKVGWKMGDYPRWLYFSKESKVKFMNEVVGVYRVLPDSTSHFTSIEKKIKFDDSFFDIKRFFDNYYSLGVSKKIEKDRIAHRLRLYCENGMFKEYASCILKRLFKINSSLSIRCFLYWILIFKVLYHNRKKD